MEEEEFLLQIWKIRRFAPIWKIRSFALNMDLLGKKMKKIPIKELASFC